MAKMRAMPKQMMGDDEGAEGEMGALKMPSRPKMPRMPGAPMKMGGMPGMPTPGVKVRPKAPRVPGAPQDSIRRSSDFKSLMSNLGRGRRG